MSEKYFEYYHCYQNIIFNQIETIGAHECLKNILSIAIVIKILFFNQIETSAAQECLNFFRVLSLLLQNNSIFQPNQTG